MKIAHLLCTIGLWAPLVLEASAAESRARAGSLAEAAAQAATSTAPGQDLASTKVVGRSQVQESIRANSGNGLKGGNAAVAATPRRGSGPVTRGAAELARSNANRLHSLRGQEARGRIAKSASRPIAPKRATASALTAPAGKQLDAHPVVPPKLPVSNYAVRTPPNLKIVPRGSTIGGPHVAGAGRVGGPPTGRAANRAVIDGTQVRRKF